MDQLLQAETESVIDDLPLFSLIPEDSDPPIQVEPELPLIPVVHELSPQQKCPVCIRHPPGRYIDTGHV